MNYKISILKYNLLRVLGTIEIPVIYMLLSIQATNPFWQNVWFGIALIKFVVNVYADYVINKQREEHLSAMQEYIENQKRKK